MPLGLAGGYGLGAMYKALEDLRTEHRAQQALRDQAAAQKFTQGLQLRQANATDRTFEAGRSDQAFQQAHTLRTEAAEAAKTKRDQDLENIDRALKTDDRAGAEAILAGMAPGPQKTVIELQLRGGPKVNADDLRTPIELGQRAGEQAGAEYDTSGKRIADDASERTRREREAAARASAAASPAAAGPAFGTPEYEEMLDRAAAGILDHTMSPSQAVANYGGQGTAAGVFKRLMTDRVKKTNPSFDYEKAESDFQYGKNKNTQDVVRYIANIKESLPALEAASDSVFRFGINSLDTVQMFLQREFGGKAVSGFDTKRLFIADEIAKIFQGGGSTGNGTSDFKLKQAAEILRGNMTTGQLKEALDAVKELIGFRSTSITKDTFMEKDAAAAQEADTRPRFRYDPSTSTGTRVR